MIDWERFSERVPLSTQVRWDFMGRENYGILLQCAPFHEYEESYNPETSAVHHPVTGKRYAEHLMVQSISGSHADPHPLKENPEDLEYLINDRWLTFDQIMA